jgi:hypothetical protein
MVRFILQKNLRKERAERSGKRGAPGAVAQTMRPAFTIQPAFAIGTIWRAALAQTRRARFRPAIGQSFQAADRQTGDGGVKGPEGFYHAPERSPGGDRRLFVFISLRRHVPRVRGLCSQFTRHFECL